VKFNPDASLLFSAGGLDESIFQWKHIPDNGGEKKVE